MSAAASTYEGYVRFGAGEVYSVQCHEGRHDECPDDTPEGTETDGGGPLEGYYCECTHHGDEDAQLPMWVHLDRYGCPMAETALCGYHEANRQAYAEMKDERLNVHDWDGKSRVTMDGDPTLACTVCGYRTEAAR